MYTTLIEKPKVLQVELNVSTLEYSTNGGMMFVPLKNILNWIEAKRLNESDELIGNDSPLGNDPTHDITGTVMYDAFDYLDENFNEVTEQYFETILTA